MISLLKRRHSQFNIRSTSKIFNTRNVTRKNINTKTHNSLNKSRTKTSTIELSRPTDILISCGLQRIFDQPRPEYRMNDRKRITKQRRHICNISQDRVKRLSLSTSKKVVFTNERNRCRSCRKSKLKCNVFDEIKALVTESENKSNNLVTEKNKKSKFADETHAVIGKINSNTKEESIPEFSNDIKLFIPSKSIKNNANITETKKSNTFLKVEAKHKIHGYHFQAKKKSSLLNESLLERPTLKIKDEKEDLEIDVKAEIVNEKHNYLSKRASKKAEEKNRVEERKSNVFTTNSIFNAEIANKRNDHAVRKKKNINSGISNQPSCENSAKGMEGETDFDVVLIDGDVLSDTQSTISESDDRSVVYLGTRKRTKTRNLRYIPRKSIKISSNSDVNMCNVNFDNPNTSDSCFERVENTSSRNFKYRYQTWMEDAHLAQFLQNVTEYQKSKKLLEGINVEPSEFASSVHSVTCDDRLNKGPKPGDQAPHHDAEQLLCSAKLNRSLLNDDLTFVTNNVNTLDTSLNKEEIRFLDDLLDMIDFEPGTEGMWPEDLKDVEVTPLDWNGELTSDCCYSWTHPDVQSAGSVRNDACEQICHTVHPD